MPWVYKWVVRDSHLSFDCHPSLHTAKHSNNALKPFMSSSDLNESVGLRDESRALQQNPSARSSMPPTRSSVASNLTEEGRPSNRSGNRNTDKDAELLQGSPSYNPDAIGVDLLTVNKSILKTATQTSHDEPLEKDSSADLLTGISLEVTVPESSTQNEAGSDTETPNMMKSPYDGLLLSRDRSARMLAGMPRGDLTESTDAPDNPDAADTHRTSDTVEGLYDGLLDKLSDPRDSSHSGYEVDSSLDTIAE